VLLDGLGADPVGQVADGELGGAEGVGVGGGDQGGGEGLDLGVDGLADRLSERVRLGQLLGGKRRGGHTGLLGRGAFSSEGSIDACVYKDSTNFQDAHGDNTCEQKKT
jgi:hypothetical protein